VGRKFSIILAADDHGGIGKDGGLPWRIKGDMAYFKETTIGSGANAVIMGRKTYGSIPKKFRPLMDRFNVVLSRDPVKAFVQYPGTFIEQSFEGALGLASKVCSGEIFVIGGASIYEEAFKHPDADLIYLTRVGGPYDCDTFVEIPEEWEAVNTTMWITTTPNKAGKTVTYRFEKLVRKGAG
jgi:dihydrofolate reductase